MFKTFTLTLVVIAAAAAGACARQPEEAVAESQEPALFEEIEPIVGRTWRAEGEDDEGEPVVDVARWEWILGRRAVRIVHSINDGAYGGQTTLYYDPDAGIHRFHYVTTAGFTTKGTMQLEDGAVLAEEEVAGHPTITRTRSTTRLVDGVLQVRSEYLEDGEWLAGHGYDYRPAPEAEPVFEPTR